MNFLMVTIFIACIFVIGFCLGEIRQLNDEADFLDSIYEDLEELEITEKKLFAESEGK